MPIYELDGQAPEFPGEGQYYVADTAVLIGRVRLKAEASVWFGAVLRGDNEWIELGERSQIQDNATLHTDPGFPLTIGSNCVIGHNVMLHGCIIGDNSLIGMGAILLNGAKIGKNSLVGAGSAGDRRQELSGQFADRGRAGARDPHARREGDRDDPRRRRHLCAALEAIRQGLEADRLNFRTPKTGCGRPLGEGRPLANPVWGRGGVGT